MALSELEVQSLSGLTQAQVLDKFKVDGFNELPSAKRRGWLKIIIDVFKEPMFILLVVCGVIYLALGDTTEAAMLLGLGVS